jgi:hypothetical protein
LKPDALFGNSIYSAEKDPSTTLIAIAGGKAGLACTKTPRHIPAIMAFLRKLPGIAASPSKFI